MADTQTVAILNDVQEYLEKRKTRLMKAIKVFQKEGIEVSQAWVRMDRLDDVQKQIAPSMADKLHLAFNRK